MNIVWIYPQCQRPFGHSHLGEGGGETLEHYLKLPRIKISRFGRFEIHFFF